MAGRESLSTAYHARRALSRPSDSNRQPMVYKTIALPLSQDGISKQADETVILPFKLRRQDRSKALSDDFDFSRKRRG